MTCPAVDNPNPPPDQAGSSKVPKYLTQKLWNQIFRWDRTLPDAPSRRAPLCVPCAHIASQKQLHAQHAKRARHDLPAALWCLSATRRLHPLTSYRYTSNPACSPGFYSYAAFLKAAAAFPNFASESKSDAVNKRDLAAFLGQISQARPAGCMRAALLFAVGVHHSSAAAMGCDLSCGSYHTY